MGRVKRVYFNGKILADGNQIITLDENQSRKLKTVLRSETGEIIEVLTNNYLAEGEICIVNKSAVQVRIIKSRPIIKPDYKFTAYQCITKREYMDFIIEKYSEIGVTDIVPVITSRSFRDIKQATYSRYIQIAKDTALQCEREVITNILPAVKIERLKPEGDENILFHERLGEKAMPKISKKNISMIIGPEGGFTDKEYNHLINIGFKPYTPIDNILKAETAAVLFSGMLMMSLNG